MANNVDVICVSCGATAPAPSDGTPVKCMYCGGSIQHVPEKTESSGTSNPQLDNIIMLAEGASEAGNYEEAYNYYNKALEIDMTNPKVWVGKGLSAVWQSTLGNVRTQEMLPAFKSAMQHSTSDEDKAEALTKIAEEAGHAYNALCSLAAGHWVEFSADESGPMAQADRETAAEFREQIQTFLLEYGEFYGWISEQEGELEERTGKALHLDLPLDHYYVEMQDYVFGSVQFPDLSYDVGGWDETYFSDHIQYTDANHDEVEGLDHPWSKRSHPLYWDLQGIMTAMIVMREEKRNYDEIPEEFKEKYPIHDPRQVVPEKKPGGCFVATACLDEQDWHELEVLRRFRDEKLQTNIAGRSFVRWYYRHGPKLALLIEKNELYRGFTRKMFVIPVARFISWIRES